MNSASDTRPVLDAVIALCKSFACTPLFVRHIGKARRDKALYAGLGSIDITAAMRAVLFLGQDPDQEQRRILAQSKTNNAQLGPSLAYRIMSSEYDMMTPTAELVTVEAPRLDWDGLSKLTALDLAAPPTTNDEEVSALEQAREFLDELLAEAPALSEDVHTAAKKSWHRLGNHSAGKNAGTHRDKTPAFGECPLKRLALGMVPSHPRHSATE